MTGESPAATTLIFLVGVVVVDVVQLRVCVCENSLVNSKWKFSNGHLRNHAARLASYVNS
jgi:hypothetical protein